MDWKGVAVKEFDRFIRNEEGTMAPTGNDVGEGRRVARVRCQDSVEEECVPRPQCFSEEVANAGLISARVKKYQKSEAL